MSACPALEGQLADGGLRLAARPVRQPPAPIVEERQEEHDRPGPRHADAALFPTTTGHAPAGLARQKITVARGAILHEEAAVAAALRLAGHIEVAVHSKNGRECGRLGAGAP